MRKIILKSTLEFGNHAEFAVIDVTDLAIEFNGRNRDLTYNDASLGKKRAAITIDYAPSDLRELRERGLDHSEMLQYYEKRIYELVKYYISGDWEYAAGREEVIELIKRHI